MTWTHVSHSLESSPGEAAVGCKSSGKPSYASAPQGPAYLVMEVADGFGAQALEAHCPASKSSCPNFWPLIWGKQLNLARPHFPHLDRGNDSCARLGSLV